VCVLVAIEWPLPQWEQPSVSDHRQKGGGAAWDARSPLATYRSAHRGVGGSAACEARGGGEFVCFPFPSLPPWGGLFPTSLLRDRVTPTGPRRGRAGADGGSRRACCGTVSRRPAHAEDARVTPTGPRRGRAGADGGPAPDEPVAGPCHADRPTQRTRGSGRRA
jgi:hypothetical protein